MKDDSLSEHEDPLVITSRIGSYDIFQIVVDIGSSIDLLFISTITTLDIKELRSDGESFPRWD